MVYYVYHHQQQILLSLLSAFVTFTHIQPTDNDDVSRCFCAKFSNRQLIGHVFEYSAN